ncbi:hypothetical protein J1N35_033595 [Gossypium stocksii]|uniref:Very-long-chain aldehyde decarbonylase CER1-like C-terminal domain-containing protein n=1 Tax=Gossypium stocksii TaxID=47602 RepID=A0A9D3UQG6_9ROSI|nr:hypothetical protein J1N35_033595 [Gossypium stocksii]
MLTRIYRRTFVVERNRFHQLTLQTWAIPNFREQVTVLHEDEYEKLDKSLGTKSEGKLVISMSYSSCKVWLVGDDLTKDEQRKANKGTLFIPFSQFPLKNLRKDRFYHTTPAMQTPKALENVDSCENWLPRRVMSVWPITGILHALEGWEEHECGYTISNIDKVWEAGLMHGFQPLDGPNSIKILEHIWQFIYLLGAIFSMYKQFTYILLSVSWTHHASL